MFNENFYHSHNNDFKNDQNNTIDECFIVRPNNAQSDESFLHKCGNTVVKGVIIDQHNHPSPLPRKTPYNIKAQLQRIIDNEYILDLTTRKFLTGSMIQSYLNGKALKLTHMEIDMAFKRINGNTNEWKISAYLPRIQKILTFVRIFTNVETAQAYQNLFDDLFRCVEKDIGETFNFHHIHGKGLGCVLTD
ncbi:hypothetical protein GLOIN_2v1778836 [Rhizophagus irregularis DAOM 181602=DAOM 197198]|uniref:Uncharacterized protein n=1 Tax=Rhizophagus irregularis (strain DAOM 181602 / DAOM 197198 / MUCL 43194) TaxID=747089 RepID=A0A2P4PR99_RHIID|nr:hypothetical protein GLOIN_2v1778836 [Rhizophagus irregularis DAOM 181602=DAOM 197198]POG67909.1 hypothetical protein GLOIN_2v1778836 [Rhizophagus irregularis DAOM 181602=DAOM 197198]|eukprot:XP_025174775.1 hypothetical protein GLOIN_2v1778836 [Rhizophagus irregularis DAOM 181602=DAOM 197198]